VPFAFFDECCNLEFRHSLGLKVLRMFESAKLGYGTMARAVMTNRFVKGSSGSERLEIRRYEDTDEGINMEWVQEH
jgi:hypothetical protein